ncbi:YbaB/EbfC family nucleoid-associated protein [Brooklawnia sp.]|uniref:YbaB/EbfC family nucleoid-associated protein n=1 Tax=Brooklawnia sp. TaxID=2699740 RepID=UPI003120364A
MFGEGMDMNALLQQAQAMQAQLQQAQDDLANSVFTGTAGGDLVEAVVTGAGELVGLTIKPEAVDTDDLEGLSDLLIAAVRDANTQAANQAQALMPDLGGLGL